MNQPSSGLFVHLHTAVICSDYITLDHTIMHKRNKPLDIHSHVKSKVDKWMKLLAEGKHDRKTWNAGKNRLLCFLISEFGRLVAFTHSKQSSPVWLPINLHSNSLSVAKSLAHFCKWWHRLRFFNLLAVLQHYGTYLFSSVVKTTENTSHLPSALYNGLWQTFPWSSAFPPLCLEHSVIWDQRIWSSGIYSTDN